VKCGEEIFEKRAGKDADGGPKEKTRGSALLNRESSGPPLDRRRIRGGRRFLSG
jgi:hypothetical protein